jgi:hypothetical protein
MTVPSSKTWSGLALSGLLAAGLAMGPAACAPPQPTPYQPLQAEARTGGGYAEARLQDDVYRVSFRGNRYTDEEAVIDMLYLRCAELTLAAGYAHFEVNESFGTFQYRLAPRYRGGHSAVIGPQPASSLTIRMGGYESGPDYVAVPDTRLAMFVIRMRKDAGSGEGEPTRYDARALTEHLAARKQPPAGGE